MMLKIKIFFIAAILICSYSTARGKNLTDLPMDDILQSILKTAESLPPDNKNQILKELLTNYISENPSDPLGRYFLGKTKMTLDEIESSLDDFGEALALEPELSDAHAASSSALYSLWDRRATDNATDTLLLSLKAIETAIEISPRRFDFYTSAARTHEALGDIQAAINMLENAIRIEPAATGAYYNLAGLYARQNRHYAAVRMLKLAYILTSPNNKLSFSTREDFYFIITPIIAASEEAIARSAELTNKGIKALAAKKPAEAAENFTGAIAVCADSAPALLEFGRFYQKQLKDTDYARRSFSLALRADPLNSSARLALCALPHEDTADNGMLPPADISECRALAIESDNIRGNASSVWLDPFGEKYYFNIGMTYARLGEIDTARSWIEAAYFSSPENKSYEQARKCARSDDCDLKNLQFK